MPGAEGVTRTPLFFLKRLDVIALRSEGLVYSSVLAPPGPVPWKVSLAAQRRWLDSAAAAAAASEDGNDSLSRHQEEMAEQRLYRQVTLATFAVGLVPSVSRRPCRVSSRREREHSPSVELSNRIL